MITKIINGIEVIDNSIVERSAELADRIYFNLIDQLGIEDECITVDDEGHSCDTEYGNEMFETILITVEAFFEEMEHVK